MEESEQDKSEQPTPFKLSRARSKGTIARGVDLGFFASLFAFAGFLWAAGGSLVDATREAMRSTLISGPALADGYHPVLTLIARMSGVMAAPLTLFIGAVFFLVLFFEVVQTGGVFSTEPLGLDFSRLNPANGLKKLFTMRLLVETAKNVLKLAVYCGVAFLIVRDALHSDIGEVSDGHVLFVVMGRVSVRLLGAFTGIALAFAVLDQLIVRRDFLKRMRMSRREVRREMRDREGDPRLKQKRKQLHAEFSKLSQSLRNLRGADVLITNPQHIALALRYDRKKMTAPHVVSVGTNRIAQRLKRLAFIYGIPVIENRLLARELLRKSGLNKPIPGACFQPVADIYNKLRQNRRLGSTK